MVCGDSSSPATSSLLTLVEMVDADLGITFLPEMAARSNMLKNTRVETWAVNDNSFRTIGLAWRKNSGRENEFQELGNFIKQHQGATKP